MWVFAASKMLVKSDAGVCVFKDTHSVHTTVQDSFQSYASVVCTGQI